jgi:diguanylate cyclase (GGDEF)-like protein/PAS domain S-box-containing protein
VLLAEEAAKVAEEDQDGRPAEQAAGGEGVAVEIPKLELEIDTPHRRDKVLNAVRDRLLARYGRRGFWTALSLVLFALAYPPLYAWGGAANAALCAFPILVAGYFWGLYAGVLMGLLVLPLTTLELVALDIRGADLPLMFGQGGPVVVVAMMVVGGVVGRLRDLRRNLIKEVAARHASDSRYADLFENAHDVVFTYNLECELTHVNRATETLLGYSRAELVGMDPAVVIPGEQWEAIQRMLTDCLAGSAAAGPYETEWLTRDGRAVVLEINPVLLRENGVAVGIQGIGRDVTERNRVEETLRQQALHDPLTGLPNRTLLADRLAQEVKRAEREERSVGVMILDLSEFKAVNDTFGHQVGDDVLRQVGSRLESATRDADTVARMGGDEFGVILTGVNGEDDAVLGARRLLAAFDDSFTVEGQRIAIGASIGISLSPNHGAEPATLMRRADVALYAAKRSGRGFAFYATEDDQFNPRRLALRAELRDAIAGGGLELHFQPKLACRDGRVTGVEALVRWRHPDHGLMAPDLFIPIAEHWGLMGPLTAWVITEALDWSDRWAERGLDLKVAVNLSARQLQDRQLPESIAAAIRGHRSTAGRLQIELTESAVMADAERALEILTRISEMGIGLSIDDFGTGYSSLSYLRQLPVNEIKIDRSFVVGLARSDSDAVIVRSIIDLGHNLGLTVVAEGVEDEAALARLTELGCDLVQGYSLSRPLPPLELADWVERRSEEP